MEKKVEKSFHVLLQHHQYYELVRKCTLLTHFSWIFLTVYIIEMSLKYRIRKFNELYLMLLFYSLNQRTFNTRSIKVKKNWNRITLNCFKRSNVLIVCLPSKVQRCTELMNIWLFSRIRNVYIIIKFHLINII